MSQPSQYLASKVLTASQPQLHIMLLDGALRFGRLAQKMWSGGTDFAEVEPMLERVAKILEELTLGTATAKEEISKQLEEQYAFLYRELAAARINREPAKLDNCLQLLDYQRETWKLAMEKLETEAASAPTSAPVLPHMNTDADVPASGLSFEA